jgi:hypothetical protein
MYHATACCFEIRRIKRWRKLISYILPSPFPRSLLRTTRRILSRTRKVEGFDLHSPSHLPNNSHSVGQVIVSLHRLFLADAATPTGAAARSLALSARADFSWPTRLLCLCAVLSVRMPDMGLRLLYLPLCRRRGCFAVHLLHPVLSFGLLHLSYLLSIDPARSRNELLHCASTPPPVLSAVPPGRIAALRFSGMCQLCLEQILQRPSSKKA